MTIAIEEIIISIIIMLHYQQLDLRLPPALGLLDDAPVGIAYLLIGVTLLINSLWDFYWYRIRIILIALSGGMWTLLTASYAMNDIGRATYSMNRGERDGEDIGGTLGFDCSGFVYHVLNYAGAWNDSYLQRAHYTGTLKMIYWLLVSLKLMANMYKQAMYSYGVAITVPVLVAYHLVQDNSPIV